jgi:hypothetical protein
MGVAHQLRVRTKKSLPEAPGSVLPTTASESHGQFEVALLFTSQEVTINVLERTAALLAGLNARINLVALQTVPYALELNNPPVSVPFNEQRLEDIASQSQIETAAHLYICRCPFDTLTSVLKPGSLLVVGTRKRRWITWERRLARKLESAGFRVLMLEVN